MDTIKVSFGDYDSYKEGDCIECVYYSNQNVVKLIEIEKEKNLETEMNMKKKVIEFIQTCLSFIKEHHSDFIMIRVIFLCFALFGVLLFQSGCQNYMTSRKVGGLIYVVIGLAMFALL